MPTHPRQMCHQMAYLQTRDPPSRRRYTGKEAAQPPDPASLGTRDRPHDCWGVPDRPHERDGPATRHEREAHQDRGIPQHRRVQSQIQRCSPHAAIACCINRPSRACTAIRAFASQRVSRTHRAGHTGSAVPIGDPGRETEVARLDEAHHHPGQGLQMPPIQPMFMLASHLHQRMIETRRAFHVDPPGNMVIPKSV